MQYLSLQCNSPVGHPWISTDSFGQYWIEITRMSSGEKPSLDAIISQISSLELALPRWEYKGPNSKDCNEEDTTNCSSNIHIDKKVCSKR